MKKISFRTISNIRIPKMNANNKRLGFAAVNAVIALFGVPSSGRSNAAASAVKRTPVAVDYTINGLSQIFGYGGFSKTSIFGKAILGLMEKLAFWKRRNGHAMVPVIAFKTLGNL